MGGMLYKGAKVVLIPSTKTETVFESIQKEKITIMPTPPALLLRWMEAPELTKYNLSSLEVVLAGGARLNAEAARKSNRPWDVTITRILEWLRECSSGRKGTILKTCS